MRKRVKNQLRLSWRDGYVFSSILGFLGTTFFENVVNHLPMKSLHRNGKTWQLTPQEVSY